MQKCLFTSLYSLVSRFFIKTIGKFLEIWEFKNEVSSGVQENIDNLPSKKPALNS